MPKQNVWKSFQKEERIFQLTIFNLVIQRIKDMNKNSLFPRMKTLDGKLVGGF